MKVPIFLRVADEIHNTSHKKYMNFKEYGTSNLLLISEILIYVSIFFEKEYDRPNLKFICDYQSFGQFLYDWKNTTTTLFEIFPISTEEYQKIEEKAKQEALKLGM